MKNVHILHGETSGSPIIIAVWENEPSVNDIIDACYDAFTESYCDTDCVSDMAMEMTIRNACDKLRERSLDDTNKVIGECELIYEEATGECMSLDLDRYGVIGNV